MFCISQFSRAHHIEEQKLNRLGEHKAVKLYSKNNGRLLNAQGIKSSRDHIKLFFKIEFKIKQLALEVFFSY